MKNIITNEQLYTQLNDPALILFDAGMLRPGITGNYVAKAVLPNAQRFDIKNELADRFNPLPNTLCSEMQFTQVMQKAGVNHDSYIVIYEDEGLFSAARAWWMLKSMGFDNVKVLSGGLSKWLESGYPVQQNYSKEKHNGNFIARYKAGYFINKQQVQNAIDDPAIVLLDARAHKRFTGEDPEPRADMRSGHIPNSLSLPYSELLCSGEAKPLNEIQQQFKALVGNAEKLQFTCGAGITACILALFADECGYANLSVYDGSWSEWGKK